MSSIRTYQTRLALTPAQEALFSQFAALYGKAKRSLFVDLLLGDKTLNTLKTEYQLTYSFTARQFNALASEVKGKISALKETQKLRVKNLKERIKRAKAVLKKVTSPKTKHNKKRRLARLELQLKQLQADIKEKKQRLCFGGKKRFHAQFNLEENGYESHEEWQKEWRAARDNQFFALGSKDESGGCQSCVATLSGEGKLSLRVRMPSSFAPNLMHLPDVKLTYGYEHIKAAIERNLSRNKEDWCPLSYRFVKDEKGWRVFISLSLPEIKRISILQSGILGVDINEDHLALTETDRFGNPIGSWKIACVTYGKSKQQREAIIGEAIKQIIEKAVKAKKPIAVEELDFEKKKAALEAKSKKRCRMLSSFAYSQIQAVLRARAYDKGIEIKEVDPADTSIIGKYKYATQQRLSEHQAAALVIGRRGQCYTERMPSQLRVPLPLPVRNRGKHVRSQWAVLAGMSKAAHGAQQRAGPSRKSPRASKSPTR